MYYKYKIYLLFFLLLSCSITFSKDILPCKQDQERLKKRSEELQQIVEEDQLDRKNNPEKLEWETLFQRDEKRRKRVGEIFGEGCLQTSSDYKNAALVFQHGNVPDHFFQTFLWAKKAVDLGDQSAKRLMTLGIDRYLVYSGKKQLFGTQATLLSDSSCWCLNQVELTFPDKKRLEYAGKNLVESLQWISSLNSKNPSCKIMQFCNSKAKNSPAGTIPGFW